MNKSIEFTIVASNEARELNTLRIRRFLLGEFVDAPVLSSFLGNGEASVISAQTRNARN